MRDSISDLHRYVEEQVLLQKFKLSEMMVGSCANGKDAVNSAVF